MLIYSLFLGRIEVVIFNGCKYFCGIVFQIIKCKQALQKKIVTESFRIIIYNVVTDDDDIDECPCR